MSDESVRLICGTVFFVAALAALAGWPHARLNFWAVRMNGRTITKGQMAALALAALGPVAPGAEMFTEVDRYRTRVRVTVNQLPVLDMSRQQLLMRGRLLALIRGAA